jgi:hypothetical protein
MARPRLSRVSGDTCSEMCLTATFERIGKSRANFRELPWSLDSEKFVRSRSSVAVGENSRYNDYFPGSCRMRHLFVERA